MLTSNEIRQQFIDFFCQKHGHTFVPSSSVVPHDDPTLLFTNAGMNQFKPYFLGTEKPPFPRAANTQKCIRAGGKHNDLDDVGKDTYHHTFFEMLGNWSFGDYFKKEAIAWAWELLTDVWQLDKTRLHVTVFEGDPANGIPRDDEAAGFWRAVGVPDAQIHLGNKKDNFWEMGDTGPCGPCTEIHYDNTPDLSGAKLVNKGTPDVIEIWNLVFIQFNRAYTAKGNDLLEQIKTATSAKKQRALLEETLRNRELLPLPAKHVDTGMGFERVTKVLQKKDSNYDTDVFTPIIAAIQEITRATPYTRNLDVYRDIAYRVIADHIRMATVAITDGARPGNKERDSVLRSVIRRAVRFGYNAFNMREPFLHKLVNSVVNTMGAAFPDLAREEFKTAKIIETEERDFLKTIERGLVLYGRAIYCSRDVLGEIEPWEKGKAERLLPKLIRAAEMPFVSDASDPDLIDVTNALSFRERLSQTSGIEFTTQGIVRALEDTSRVPGEFIFQLHTTHGFPPDLTQQMACEDNLKLDLERYKELMREHEEKSRGKVHTVSMTGGIVFGGSASVALWKVTDDSPKWETSKIEAKLIGFVPENGLPVYTQDPHEDERHVPHAAKLSLIFDKTCFYVQTGGQVGDTGTIRTPTGFFAVSTVQKNHNTVLHVGEIIEGSLRLGQKATLDVHPARLDTMRNHTATHLMNWALREVLGDHVEQKGSLVDADKTRFDFTHDKPMTHDEVAEVERLVNEKILADQPVTAVNQPLAQAKGIPGVRAVFGEKYPDPVRVVIIGADKPESATAEMSVEFCGGTHLSRTSQACLFKIVGQEGVAKGVRRITAVTGPKALAYTQQLASVVGELSERFKCRPEELPTRIESLQEEVKKLQQQLRKGAASDLAGSMDKLLASAIKFGDVTVIVGEIPGGPDDAIRTQVDRIKQTAGSSVVLVGWVDGDKVGLLAAVTEDVIKKGVKAGQLVGEIAKIVGGGGGGRPNMAQAGGKEPAKLGEALAQARRLIEQQLTK